MPLMQLKLLISLAHVDGEVGEREKSYISTIAKANGVHDDDVKQLFGRKHELIVPDALTATQRFDYIFSLVQLMKIDERLYKEEIRYCARVASKLGYDQTVLFDLLLHVKQTMESIEQDELRKLTVKHLNK